MSDEFEQILHISATENVLQQEPPPLLKKADPDPQKVIRDNSRNFSRLFLTRSA